MCMHACMHLYLSLCSTMLKYMSQAAPIAVASSDDDAAASIMATEWLNAHPRFGSFSAIYTINVTSAVISVTGF